MELLTRLLTRYWGYLALARRLVNVLWALLRDGRLFTPAPRPEPLDRIIQIRPRFAPGAPPGPAASRRREMAAIEEGRALSRAVCGPGGAKTRHTKIQFRVGGAIAGRRVGPRLADVAKGRQPGWRGRT